MYNLDIGVIVQLEDILKNGIETLKELDLNVCQINCWDSDLYTEENAEKIKKMIDGKIKISSLWVGWPLPARWDFIDGPHTLGLVPVAYRAERIHALKKGADFAKMIGVSDITTHVGFIPENPTTTEYRETVIAIREVADYCKSLDLYFNFETGQETPITLIRTIEDIGLDNLGINIDPANLLMYGKANPVDAVGIYKDKIRGVHVKDGKYPTNGRELGVETAIGEGMVNFPLLIDKLHENGYKGPLIIEREISGDQQIADILKAKEELNSILAKY